MKCLLLWWMPLVLTVIYLVCLQCKLCTHDVIREWLHNKVVCISQGNAPTHERVIKFIIYLYLYLFVFHSESEVPSFLTCLLCTSCGIYYFITIDNFLGDIVIGRKKISVIFWYLLTVPKVQNYDIIYNIRHFYDLTGRYNLWLTGWILLLLRVIWSQ